jgi:hypothetical protein
VTRTHATSATLLVVVMMVVMVVVVNADVMVVVMAHPDPYAMMMMMMAHLHRKLGRLHIARLGFTPRIIGFKGRHGVWHRV